MESLYFDLNLIIIIVDLCVWRYRFISWEQEAHLAALAVFVSVSLNSWVPLLVLSIRWLQGESKCLQVIHILV